jgi:signal transduction histidine kinase
MATIAAELLSRNDSIREGRPGMEAPRTQERILAGWAHDLGKPLQVIGIHARRLADEVGQDPQARLLARAIVALSDDALTVVDRLMESARPDERRVVRPERLRAILKRVIAVVHGLHPGGALWIRGSIPEVEIERSGQLIAVLVNLADNAVRASERSQSVTIMARLDADELKIDVVDRGSGMSNIVRQRAFEPYSSTRRTSRSTGLGLSECRAQIESIGGFLELESVEGVGTRASVTLPRAGNPISSLAIPES